MNNPIDPLLDPLLNPLLNPLKVKSKSNKKIILIVIIIIIIIGLALGLGLGLGLKKSNSTISKNTNPIIKSSIGKNNNPVITSSMGKNNNYVTTSSIGKNNNYVTTSSIGENNNYVTTSSIGENNNYVTTSLISSIENNTDILQTALVLNSAIGTDIITPELYNNTTQATQRQTFTFDEPLTQKTTPSTLDKRITTKATIITTPSPTTFPEPISIPILVYNYNYYKLWAFPSSENPIIPIVFDKSGKLIEFNVIAEESGYKKNTTLTFRIGIKNKMNTSWIIKKDLSVYTPFIMFNTNPQITNVSFRIIPSDTIIINKDDKVYIEFDSVDIRLHYNITVYIDPNITDTTYKITPRLISKIEPITFDPLIPSTNDTIYTLSSIETDLFNRYISDDINNLSRLLQIQMSGLATYTANFTDNTSFYIIGIVRNNNWLISKKVYFNSTVKTNSPFKLEIVPKIPINLFITDKILLELHTNNLNKVRLDEVKIILKKTMFTIPESLDNIKTLTYNKTNIRKDDTLKCATLLPELKNSESPTGAIYIQYIGDITLSGELVNFTINADVFNSGYRTNCSNFIIGIKRNNNWLVVSDPQIIDSTKNINFSISSFNKIIVENTDMVYLHIILCPNFVYRMTSCCDACDPVINNLNVNISINTNTNEEIF